MHDRNRGRVYQMSEIIDDSGDQPGVEVKTGKCYACEVWCECDGSGWINYGPLMEECDCSYTIHSCGKNNE